MSIKLVILVVCVLVCFGWSEDIGFTYNGFQSANLSLDGMAEFTANGLLKLTNGTKRKQGHAFYPNLINFKNSSNGSALSFSNTFIFAIVPEKPNKGQGLVFVIAPTRGLPGASPNQYLGLFNWTNNGNTTNHVFFVELDTTETAQFNDINDNHVGINFNGLNSELSSPAGYYDKNGVYQTLTLNSGNPIQVWVEYDGVQKQINVTLAPINIAKPTKPLLSLNFDISPIINKSMYVGFSSATGEAMISNFVLGWSFMMHRMAQALDLSQLPQLPRVGPKEKSRFLTIGLPLISIVLVLVATSGIVYHVIRNRKFAEVLEDWEPQYGPQRFKFKDLYIATKGFRDKELLGSGGFGRVYRGVLPASKIEIAVKRVSHESRQGMREFVAEIVSMGRLRHRNLVQLLGYCRRKGELLLVYDYMPNGSLDKFLYDQQNFTLNWSQRFWIIKGVASGLFYLHEEWEQVVVHRDVKASNVLLDRELNGKLGDFGLARLYDHGTDPQTSLAAGTLGFLAPELTRTGKATTSTDVYAFGAFLLEVACGRRPIEPRAATDNIILVDWVFSYGRSGDILPAVDPKLGTDYIAEEVDLVLKLGLLCSHSEPAVRPSMRQVVHYLEADLPLPEFSSHGIPAIGLRFAHLEGFDDSVMSASSVTESLLSGGR